MIIEAMKQAREALRCAFQNDVSDCAAAIIELDIAIEQAEKQDADQWYEKALWGEKQEALIGLAETSREIEQAEKQAPVAVMELGKGGWDIVESVDVDWLVTLPFGTKLYAAPPSKPWVTLAEDRLRQIHTEDQFGLFCDFEEFLAIARTIETVSKVLNHE